MNTTALLRLLCLVACAWTCWMVVGVARLAPHPGGISLFALGLELAVFAGAGLLPLLVILRPHMSRESRPLIAFWIACIVYVTLLALNLIRLGSYAKGGIRLALWFGIAILFIRVLRSRGHRPNDASKG